MVVDIYRFINNEKWQLYINLHQLCKNTALYLHLV